MCVNVGTVAPFRIHAKVGARSTSKLEIASVMSTVSPFRARPPGFRSYKLGLAILPPALSRWQPPPSFTQRELLDMGEWGPYNNAEDESCNMPNDTRCVWKELPVEALQEELANSAEAFLAESKEELTDEELRVEPSSHQGGWLESDCAPVSDDGKSVQLRDTGGGRQTLLSRDWVHIDHSPPRRTWTVRASKATYSFGDIYWGVSEAQSFNRPGRTYLFDVRGNGRYGYHPLELSLMWPRATVARTEGNSFKGAFEGCKDDRLEVTLDLGEQTLTILNTRTKDQLVHKLTGTPPMRCARLCASLQTMGDTLVIE